MYQQPKLEFYGTLRELTQIGGVGTGDTLFINSVVEGTNPVGDDDFVCTGVDPAVPGSGTCFFVS